jgi:hypothetical protein
MELEQEIGELLKSPTMKTSIIVNWGVSETPHSALKGHP